VASFVTVVSIPLILTILGYEVSFDISSAKLLISLSSLGNNNFSSGL